MAARSAGPLSRLSRVRSRDLAAVYSVGLITCLSSIGY